MKYGQTISQSWNLLWKHKVLWVFGLLAAWGGVGGGIYFYLRNPLGEPSDFREQDIISPGLMQQLEHLEKLIGRGEFFQATDRISTIIGFPAIFLAALICFLIVFIIALWLVSIITRAGLVAAVQADYKGESISFTQLFAVGTGKLWQLVGLKLILFGILGLLFFFFFASIFSRALPGYISTVILLSFILYIFALYVMHIHGYAFYSIVMDDMEISQAIKHGWRVGMGNFGPTLGLNQILSLAITVAILILAGIFIFVYHGAGFGSYTTTAVTSIASLLMGMAVNTVFVTLYSVAYSKAYLEFTGRKPARVNVELSTPSLVSSKMKWRKRKR